MANQVKLAVFAGSLRAGSYNKQLARAAAAVAEKAGASVTLMDLKDYPMPVYNQDDETASGLPEHAKRFQDVLRASHGFIIASPEYNSSIPGGLKNAIDWASRSAPTEPLVAFRKKTALLLSASPGNLGGIRSLATLRSILSNIGTLVLSEQLAVPRAHEAFVDGALKDPKQQATLERFVAELVRVTSRLL